MPIQYVGGNTGTWVGSTGTTNTISLTALTGGIATSAAIGDLVIAVYSTGSTADRTLSITTGYTLIATELYSNGTSYDTNLRVAYKVLTAADTTVSFGPTGNSTDAGAAAVYVFRGVSGVIFDVTTTTATGTGTGRPTPPAITPVDPGTVIVAIGAGAAQTGAVYTTATLTAFRSVTSSDTNDAMLGIGHFFWTSGTYTPAQFTGGTTNAADSWAAMTIALQATQTFNETVTESVTVTDTQAQGSIYNDSISEAVTATESSDAIPQRNVSITESATATDTPTATETGNTWLLENTTTGPFVLGNLQGSGGITGGTTNANASLGIRFIANQTAQIGVVTFIARRSSYTVAPTQPGKVTLWQLASNSLTALPNIILGEIDFDFLAGLPSASGNVAFDFTSLNITLTSGVGYAVTITTPSDGGAALNSAYVILTGYQSGADTNRFNYSRALYTNLSGTYPSSYSTNSLFAFRINVLTVEATADTQLSGSGFTADITESVTATDTQDSLFAITADTTESVTATDAQDAANTISDSITESVTATDSSTRLLTSNQFVSNGGQQSVLVSGTFTLVRSIAYTTNAFAGVTFISGSTGYISTIITAVIRTAPGNPAPTQPGTLELWQLSSNTITALPSTLIASVPFDLTSVPATSVAPRQIAFFPPGTAPVVEGVAYAIGYRAGSDWTAGTTSQWMYWYGNGSVTTSDNAIKPYQRIVVQSVGGVWSSSSYTPTGPAYIYQIVMDGAYDAQLGGFIAAASITESVTATDAQDGALNIVSDITESVTATDAQVVDAATIDASITESVTASDSETADVIFTADITESVTATDSQAAGFVAAASITESVTATDTQDALLTYLVSITESVTATDTQDSIVTIEVADTETVTATDSQVAIFTTSVSITETVTATDSETASIVFTADITESVTATDTEDAELVTNVSASESVTATETQNVDASTFNATITESVTATESAIGVGGEVYEGGAFAFGPIASATIADANTNYNAINTQGAVVYLTGVFGTGQTGTATVRTDVLVSLTGVQATGYVGQTAVNARGIYEGGAFAFGSFASAAIADANTDYTDIQTQSVEVYATSVTGTGQTGTLTITGTSNTTLTGVSGTGQIGDEATSSDANVYVSGEQATGFTGTVDTTGTANVTLTGVVGTGQTGTVSFYAEANVNVTGVQGTGAVGQVAVAVQDIITGGAFAFGAIAASTIADARADYDQIQTQGVEVYLTGVTGTGVTGTVAVTADNNIAVTGVVATGVVPQRDTTNGGAFALGPIATAPIADAYEPIPEVICTSSTAVTGVVGTGETGTLTMSGDSNVYPIGVSGAGQIGDEATSADANVYLSGVQATGQTGTVVVIGAANVYPLGVVGTTVLGTVDTTSDANVYPTGVVGSGQVGTIAMTGAANVYLTGVQAVGQIGYVIIESGYVVTGVQATAYVGTVSVWSDINDSQNPDWQAINDSQVGSWSDVNDTQASSWQPVDDSQTNDWEEVDDGNTIVWKQVVT